MGVALVQPARCRRMGLTAKRERTGPTSTPIPGPSPLQGEGSLPSISRSPACRPAQVSQGWRFAPPRAAEGARPGAVELRSDGAPFAPYAAATARRRDETGPLGERLGMR